MRPKRAITASTKAVTCSGWRMSQTSAKTSRPAALSSATAASRRSRLRPQMATRAPRAPSSRTVARPMPEPPPVTMATSPANRPGANAFEVKVVMAGR